MAIMDRGRRCAIVAATKSATAEARVVRNKKKCFLKKVLLWQ